MTRRLTDDELRELGIARDLVGPPRRVPLPAAPIGEGLRATSMTEASGEEYLPVPAPVALQHGLCVHASERFLRVNSLDGAALDLRAPAGAQGNFRRDASDPGTVYVRLGARALIGILAAKSGSQAPEGIIIDEAGGFHPVGFHLAPIPEPCSFESPVREWATSSGDAWMLSFVEERLAFDDPWHDAVAAGAFPRLVRFADRSIARRALTGDFDPIITAPRRWAEALTQEQVRDLRHFLSHDTAAMHAMLDDLEPSEDEETLTPFDEPEWQDLLLAALHRRDDIESCLDLVLLAGGSADGLGLESLDRRGLALVTGIPRFVRLDDQWLRRASVADPEAWWVQPAVEDDDDPGHAGDTGRSRT